MRRQHHLSVVQLGRAVGVPPDTDGRILRRHRLSCWRGLEPKPPPPRRYEHARPGDLLHVDLKKLSNNDGVGHRITGMRHDRGRGIGWSDSRHHRLQSLAYVEILPESPEGSGVDGTCPAADTGPCGPGG